MSQPLTWNSNVIDRSNNRTTIDVRVKWMNYQDTGVWKPVDCRLVEDGANWSVDKSAFKLRLPKHATGTVEFVSTCEHDIFSKTSITEPGYSVRVTPIGVSPVQGIVNASESDTLVFKNAYAGFGDLIYRARHGRAMRFEKIIRINTLPTGTGPLRLSFKLTHDAGQVQIVDKALGNPMRDTIRQMQIDVSNELRKTNNDVKDLMRRQFAMLDLQKQPWLGARKIVTQPVSFHQQTANGRRGIGIKTAQVWDSSTPPKRETIQLEMVRETDGSITLTKIIPRAFLAVATYPVFTDTVSTFYPDADVESTSVDGWVARNPGGTGESWATIIAGAGVVNNDAVTIGRGMSFSSNGLLLNNYGTNQRGILLFDTSSIPDADIISDATLSKYGESKQDNLAASPDVNVYGSTPASSTAIAAADYGQTQNTAFSTAVGYSSFSTTGYNDFVLNATGLAAVSATGISKFSSKNANYDVAATQPPWATPNTNSAMNIYNAEQTGTDKDPKLVVTYAPAVTTNVMMIGCAF